MAGVILLAMLIGLGVAAWLGLTVDSRDPRYGVGLMLSSPASRPSEQQRGDAPCGDTCAAETS
jgi:hypothetical protein